MLRSVATLQEIITPTTLAFLVHALSMNRTALVFVEERTEMFRVGLGFRKRPTLYCGKAETENEGGEKKRSGHFNFFAVGPRIVDEDSAERILSNYTLAGSKGEEELNVRWGYTCVECQFEHS